MCCRAANSIPPITEPMVEAWVAAFQVPDAPEAATWNVARRVTSAGDAQVAAVTAT